MTQSTKYGRGDTGILPQARQHSPCRSVAGAGITLLLRPRLSQWSPHQAQNKRRHIASAAAPPRSAPCCPPAHPGASASGMFAMAPMMKQATMLLAAVAVTKSCRTSCCNPNPRSTSSHRAHDVRSCCGTQHSPVDATCRVMLLQHNDSVLGRRQCACAGMRQRCWGVQLRCAPRMQGSQGRRTGSRSSCLAPAAGSPEPLHACRGA